MLDYPLQSSKIIGDATLAQTLAFLKSPTLLARRLSVILGAQKFIAHVILGQRYTIQGGVLAYFEDETVLADEAPETVTPGSSYPMLTLDEDQVKMLAAFKVGFGTSITDEAVGRELIAPVDRALGKLANTLVADFDTKALAVIKSRVSQTVTGGAWTSCDQVIGDVFTAKATILDQKRGFQADTVVLTELQYAKVMPKLLPLLPREGGNPVTASDFPNILDLNWLHSPFLPSNWVPLVLDSQNLGGIGHENVPSPEYAAVSTVVPNDASNVEVARMRLGNDATNIQLRKCDVAVVRNPLAGVQITETGL